MGRTRRVQLAVIILFGLLSLSFVIQKESSAAQQPNPAGTPKQAANPRAQEEPKNLQVLKGMSGQQVVTLMQSWAAALGVQCNYCHVRPFEADTPRKAVARLMQRDYVTALKHKDGRPLSCQDCHQGQPNFLRTRPFEGVLGRKLPDVRVLTGMDKDQLIRVMDGLAKALGTKCNYCHTAEFEDDTSRKQVARFMMAEFTRGLVKQDGGAVSCADCHQGHGRLLSVLPFPRPEGHRPAGGNEPTPKKARP